MDANSTDLDIDYSDSPPMLLAASSDEAMSLAEHSAAAAGLRVGACLPIEEAAERIEQQIAATAVWVELDRDGGHAMDELLAKIGKDVDDGRYAAVVSATSDLLDPIAASLDGSGVELIIDAGEADRVAALAIATSRRGMPHHVADVASDNNAERLRQLSEEVSRIASTLARLSTGPGAPIRPIEKSSIGDVPPLSVETVRSVIRARRMRARYFRDELFADPAWDMLLDLLQAEIAQLRVPVSSLCIAASVPATTAECSSSLRPQARRCAATSPTSVNLQ